MKNKIIELAKKQTGNDYTIYCRDMGYNYRIEWCACFISWLAEKLDITDIIPVDMSCNSQIAKFKKMGVWHTDKNFQSGDILYYDWDNSGDADHVGIIEIGLELDNIDTLKKVIACIQSLPDVYSVKRIQTSSSMVKKSSPTKSSKSYKHKKTTKKKDES